MTVEPRTNFLNTRWAILTGEYPPQPGGVSDYTQLVAEGLASVGDEVYVYVPPHSFGPDSAAPGVKVRRLPDRFGLRGLRWLDREVVRDRPDRILIQYVPHAFGLKAMNLPFTAWVSARASRLAPVWVMFHEVAFPYVRRPLRHNILAFVNRKMAWDVARSAERVMVSIPSWGRLVSEICPRARPAEWLPIPSNVAMTAEPAAVGAARLRHAPDAAAPLVGHFGTFGRSIRSLLEPSVVELLKSRPLARVVFIGRGSERCQVDIVAAYPELVGQVSATGELSAGAVAAHLRACDLLLQPYADGVSCRRTSMMAGLANRVPIVTNSGHLSEPLWATSTGVTVVAGPDPVALAAASVEVLALPTESRLALGARGAELYFNDFSLEHTIASLHC